jgi:hypothetical protein
MPPWMLRSFVLVLGAAARASSQVCTNHYNILQCYRNTTVASNAKSRACALGSMCLLILALLWLLLKRSAIT